MSEQTPKTPRQLGEEAKALANRHQTLGVDLARKTIRLEGGIYEVEWADGWARALESGKKTYRGRRYTPEVQQSPEAWRNQRDKQIEKLGELIVAKGEAQDAHDANLVEASRHYKQNAAGYHDLAVLEAAMDGVEIHVQQPESLAEPIEVHKA